MGTNAAAERLSADKDIKDEGVLLEFVKQTLDAEGLETGTVSTYAYAMVGNATTSVNRDIQNGDETFFVSAQQSDSSGNRLNPLLTMDIAYGDSIVRPDGERPVLQPGVFGPKDDPIFYNVQSGTRTATAP